MKNDLSSRVSVSESRDLLLRSLDSLVFLRKTCSLGMTFFLLFFIFSFTSCDAVYRVVQKEGAEEKDLLGDIIPFEHNPQVEEVQKLLGLYGYGVGKVDGKFGNVTRDAIARFQADQGLEVNRFVDQATWDRLHAVKNSPFFHNGSVDIKIVQTALQQAGFNPGPIDGKPGKKTSLAIKEFQAAHQLAPDGVVGLRTIQAMEPYIKTP